MIVYKSSIWSRLPSSGRGAQMSGTATQRRNFDTGSRGLVLESIWVLQRENKALLRRFNLIELLKMCFTWCTDKECVRSHRVSVSSFHFKKWLGLKTPGEINKKDKTQSQTLELHKQPACWHLIPLISQTLRKSTNNFDVFLWNISHIMLTYVLKNTSYVQRVRKDNLFDVYYEKIFLG